MYNFQRNDEKFNLDNVEFVEIFNYLRPAIVTSLKTQKEFGGDKNIFVFLEDLYSFREPCYGEDYNIYPKLSLSSKVIISGNNQPVNFQVVVKPFDVELLLCKGYTKHIRTDELTGALTAFITTKFPESDYLEKKAEYQKMSDLYKRANNRLHFEK